MTRMTYPSHRLMLGIGLLALALVPGCRRCPQHCPCGVFPNSVIASSPAGPRPAASMPPITGREKSAELGPLGKAELAPTPGHGIDRLIAAERPSDPAAPAQPSDEALVGEFQPSRASDYRWLIGHLQYVHVRNAWRLRYAAPDEHDRYGGAVTLTDLGPMTEYRSGQLVRVEGCLLDPASTEPSPAYHVQRIQSLSRP